MLPAYSIWILPLLDSHRVGWIMPKLGNVLERGIKVLRCKFSLVTAINKADPEGVSIEAGAASRHFAT